MKYFKQFLVLAILSIAMLSTVAATDDVKVESSATTTDILTLITGKVTDLEGNPLAGVSVTAYCRHDGSVNEIEQVETVSSGSYSASVFNWGSSVKCVMNDEAWVVVDHDGNEITSPEVEVQRQSGVFDYAKIPGIGVPEFSAVTVGLAIMGTMAGLVVLRKRQ